MDFEAARLLAPDLNAAVQTPKKLAEATGTFFPLIERGGDWVVILDSAGRLVHYVQAEGFF